MLWLDKYKPKLEEVPQNTTLLENYVLNYLKQKKKALLIHGPAGTGKTAAVYALAKKHNLELVEINASDYRTAKEIEAKIGTAMKQQSLFGGSKLILVDELDGISGVKDRGGITELVKLFQKSTFPFILIANDAWDKKFNSLRTKSQLLEYSAIETNNMLPVLLNIATKENLPVDEIVLKTIARRSGGDLRGAIIDLQILAAADELTIDGINTLSEREQSETIKNALVKIFKTTDPSVALGALNLVDQNIDESMLWIDENLPKEYYGTDLARAYNALAKADVYKGRIMRWQYWRYLSYVNVLITAGIAVAKDQKNPKMIDYERTQRILKIWMANQKYAKRKRVAAKIAHATHCSHKKALQETLPNIQYLFKQGHTTTDLIAEELDLDEEELEWLRK
ncbi:hypothetical protein COV18_04025 [Candidatus Woesearchaeota archaeon CG10_big_fil_rev_8_21_14_0_10_37_12]|nr:MAG: hypothetical protein COV18_04025 [Candidatus Woesearchaeota archaeon CG10_big_fil_rev_8_21_14_0_10_37_12]